jgi:hypothetical protein
MNPRRQWEEDNAAESMDADHDPDPSWALEDLDDDSAFDNGGPRRLRLWVGVIAVLIVLALLIQLGWPLVMDLLDREQDSRGFPTPGVI